MTHRGLFQPLPFCDSVILSLSVMQPGVTNLQAKELYFLSSEVRILEMYQNIDTLVTE